MANHLSVNLLTVVQCRKYRAERCATQYLLLRDIWHESTDQAWIQQSLKVTFIRFVMHQTRRETALVEAFCFKAMGRQSNTSPVWMTDP